MRWKSEHRDGPITRAPFPAGAVVMYNMNCQCQLCRRNTKMYKVIRDEGRSLVYVEIKGHGAGFPISAKDLISMDEPEF